MGHTLSGWAVLGKVGTVTRTLSTQRLAPTRRVAFQLGRSSVGNLVSWSFGFVRQQRVQRGSSFVARGTCIVSLCLPLIPFGL